MKISIYQCFPLLFSVISYATLRTVAQIIIYFHEKSVSESVSTLPDPDRRPIPELYHHGPVRKDRYAFRQHIPGMFVEPVQQVAAQTL